MYEILQKAVSVYKSHDWIISDLNVLSQCNDSELNIWIPPAIGKWNWIKNLNTPSHRTVNPAEY